METSISYLCSLACRASFFFPLTGQLFSQALFSYPDVQSTSEGSAVEDDSYMGYSSAVGDLDGDGKSDVVVGMPRGANLTGKVHFLIMIF